MSDAIEHELQDAKGINLSSYTSGSFSRGMPVGVELAWIVVSAIFFRHSLAIGSGLKTTILRAFGANVGKGVVIKPSVQIKFPWKLRIGDYVWIGEHVWIDNLDTVVIADNVCLSQGCLLLCGNHDYTKQTFDLVTKPIAVDAGAWVGARAIVGPGVRIGCHAVLTAGSIASRDLDPYSINQGNPALPKRRRIIN